MLASLVYAAEFQALCCCWFPPVHPGLVCVCWSDVLAGSSGVLPTPHAAGKPPRLRWGEEEGLSGVGS